MPGDRHDRAGFQGLGFDMGGRMPGKRSANMVLPPPGGPMSNKW
jgi:hypothetical protein